jgi:hypothetical protein
LRLYLDVLRLKEILTFFQKGIDIQYVICYNTTVPKERKVHKMAKSKKQLHEEIRAKFMKTVADFLMEQGEEVLQTGSQEIAIPCVDSEGNDEYMVVTFKVPTGSRDGEAYDGYSMAEEYAIKVRQQAEKAEKAKAEKARKAEKDKAMREQKAKAKAEREAKK